MSEVPERSWVQNLVRLQRFGEELRRGTRPSLIDLERALQELHQGGVEFVVVGGVADLLSHTQIVTVSGLDYRCLSLARLIHVKGGRPKDLEAIAELEALREERRDQEGA